MSNKESESNLVWAGVVLVFAMYFLYHYFTTSKYTSEKIFSDLNSITMTECSYPFGSWFHMDDIGINSSGFRIVHRGFFTNETIDLPYENIKKVVFKKGYYWKSITLVPDRKSFWGEGNETFYLKGETAYTDLRLYLDSFKHKALSVVEQINKGIPDLAYPEKKGKETTSTSKTERPPLSSFEGK
ncbi:MAG: hypothetical protein HY607_00535 [Planctomycetes bacterium]|uniref:hypothetical protein n=1 Tax=Candidatus Wunengus californicus TaxID=3367619 RepID=UPI004028BB3D|nr:hypothetical protein [Planctomycetota bacterium]